ncbi:rhotekin-like [Tubulanus polymorphus]|uniref:rhotekin-like n=1 Tax=Tubulanus polymorphus TaxID=672921 RepID=UPI003DA33E69
MATPSKRKRQIRDDSSYENLNNFQILKQLGNKQQSKRIKLDLNEEEQQQTGGATVNRSTSKVIDSLIGLGRLRGLPPRGSTRVCSTLKTSSASSKVNLKELAASPFRTLKGSLRRKLESTLRRQRMRGLQDYNLPPSPRPTPVAAANRTISTTAADTELQQKIDIEIKMRDGTAKLLAASKHPVQLLEAAKSLLTSNTRVLAYMSELQKRKSDEILHKNKIAQGNQVPCKAKVALSDIRIPLMWKDSDHFKNKGDHRRYAVFCMLKIGTEIFDTTLIKSVDRSLTDITFNDVIIFNEIGFDFQCILEVYCHKVHDDLTIASTPKKLKKKLNEFSNSLGQNVGRRLSGLKDEDIMNSMLVGPRFDLVAQATLTVDEIKDSIGTYELKLMNTSTSSGGDVGLNSELPLFGHFCCRLAAQPYCLLSDTVSGYLHLQCKRDNTQWNQYWCSLKNLKMSFWKSCETAETEKPEFIIPVTKHSQICEGTQDPPICDSERSHSFQIIDTVNCEQHTLCTDTSEQTATWWEALQQHLLDQVVWKQACETVMNIKMPSPKRLPSFLRKDSLTLYEETEIDLSKASCTSLHHSSIKPTDRRKSASNV